jgi:hypothetical protein
VLIVKTRKTRGAAAITRRYCDLGKQDDIRASWNAAFSLRTGKSAGNFTKTRLEVPICPRNGGQIQCVLTKFPTRISREFAGTEQGILERTREIAK